MKNIIQSDRDEKIHDLAVKNGCSPKWYDGILGWAWHCTCKNLSHACDSQCSAISLKSAKKKAGSRQVGDDPRAAVAYLESMGFARLTPMTRTISCAR